MLKKNRRFGLKNKVFMMKKTPHINNEMEENRRVCIKNEIKKNRSMRIGNKVSVKVRPSLIKKSRKKAARNRRADLRSCLERLRDLLPFIHSSEASTAHILMTATSFIKVWNFHKNILIFTLFIGIILFFPPL